MNDFDLKFGLPQKVDCSLSLTGKNQYRQFFVVLFLISSFYFVNSYGQQANQSANNYSASVSGKVNFIKKPFTPFFIENKGQFNQYDANEPVTDLKIPVYGSQMGNAIVLFTKNSIQFVENVAKHAKEDKEEKKPHKEHEFFTHRQALTF